VSEKVRYVVADDRKDGWPVIFRATCERTLRSEERPEGEGLFEMTVRLAKHGYRIYNEPQDFDHD
jgi:hypothetical protein